MKVFYIFDNKNMNVLDVCFDSVKADFICDKYKKTGIDCNIIVYDIPNLAKLNSHVAFLYRCAHDNKMN